MIGNFTYESKKDNRNFLGKLWDKATTGVDMYQKKISGSGTIVLGPPTLGSFYKFELKPSQNLIIDAGIFVACGECVALKTTSRKFWNSLFSGESAFEISVTRAW